MNEHKIIIDKIEQCPVIGIFRGLAIDHLLNIAELLEEEGYTTMEVTLNSEDAPKSIEKLRQSFPSLNIGAGTICTSEDLKIALDSGAQFIVTPILNQEVVTRCYELKVPVFPGALTPTEIYQAMEYGADAVKVFPATTFGPRFVKDVLGPLDKAKLVPTGGVSLQNIRSFFAAGCYAVGMGGNLVNSQDIIEKKFRKAREHLALLSAEIQPFMAKA